MSDYPMLISNKLHSFRNFTGTKIVKAERKRELVHGFPRRILSKTMSKIAKNGE